MQSSCKSVSELVAKARGGIIISGNGMIPGKKAGIGVR